jgi:hypothetical protein
MGIRVVLTHVMPVLGHGFMGSQFLQPDLIVVMQAGFIVINENRGRDVHGIDEDKAFLDVALPQAFINLGRNIDESPPCRDVEPQFFSKTLHEKVSLSLDSSKSQCQNALRNPRCLPFRKGEDPHFPIY